MIKHITIIHEEVYEYLNQIITDVDNNIRFTLRKTNRDGRLDEGYWFYGNEKYLALSFWSGNDWKNRTPNIIFSIIPNGSTYLEINTSDSKVKREFAERYLVQKLNLKKSGKKYYKEYPGTAYIESLRWFLTNDKKLIDNVIEINQSFFETHPLEDRIGFIDSQEFDQNREKVDQYRKQQRDEFLPQANRSIKYIKIQNYGPIINVELSDISEKSRWIFLTGENGTGKSSILKAIATGLTSKRLEGFELKQNPKFKVEFGLYNNRNEVIEVSREGNATLTGLKLWVSGFVGYGAIRLQTNHSGHTATAQRAFRMKIGNAYSLFHNDGVLLDLLYKQSTWNKNNKLFIEKRLNAIREILYEVIPNLHKVEFETSTEIAFTKYYEEDSQGEPFKNYVTFELLATGIRSMLAMVGDMIARLFDQQPEIDDPSELSGVVLIDEIDIHLHPILQKRLVETLNSAFTKIQFIVTTHSPIPLLGAPKNSVIYKVIREPEHGVKVLRLDDKLYLGDLLPNTILTSPIFGFNDIVPNSHDSGKLIRPKDNYNELISNDFLRAEIHQFLDQTKENELIKLFENRTKK